MNFFRTDGQAALNTLLVTARETLDHYRDAAELVEAQVGQIFRDISLHRRAFIHRLEDAVRASGILPAVPDPDKEAGEMLLHHVAALIKDHYENDILDQRIAGEEKLAQLVIEATATDTEARSLLDEFAAHVAETIAQLQALRVTVINEDE